MNKTNLTIIIFGILLLGLYSGFRISDACNKQNLQKTLFYTIEKPFLDPSQYGYWTVLFPLGEKEYDYGCYVQWEQQSEWFLQRREKWIDLRN